jgi:hypothetical protein
MNECCKHLFREAVKELELKDKRISHLESEVTRLFDPIRQYWNEETQQEIQKLKADREVLLKLSKLCLHVRSEEEAEMVEGAARQALKSIGEIE